MAVNRLYEILEEKGGEVLKVGAESSVFEAVQLMVEKNVGSLLVTEGGDITGIVTERDYLRRITLEGRTDRGDARSRDHVVAADRRITGDDRRRVHGADDRPSDPARPRRRGGQAWSGLVSIGDLVKFKSKLQTFEIQYLTNYITAG